MHDNVYFIRHNWHDKELREEINKKLLNEKRIAIHFNDKAHKKFEDYSSKEKKKPGFKEAWSIFNQLGKNGGIVLAQYDEYFIIGKVKKGTKVEFRNIGSKKGLKTYTFDRSKKILRKKCLNLVASLPRYRTITEVKKTEVLIRAYYDKLIRKEKTKPIIELLSPKLQEQMCVEWLRSELCDKSYKIKYLILKPGLDMEGIDIYGKTCGDKYLFGQVSYTNNKKELGKKIEALNKLAEKGIKILFTLKKENNPKQGVKLVSMVDIFSQLARNKDYKKMIQDMCFIPKPETK